MADAQSNIGVRITGDAKGLQRELASSDKAIGGLTASAGKLVGALALGAATAAIVDFGQTALNEADRVGDATQRLQLQVGDLSDELERTAGDFAKLGQSRQDMLELEAAFADTATAIGLADEDIVKFADDAAATAGALSLITDMDAAQVIDLIGKAADGGAKAMKALGINITDAEIEARALADTGKSTADSLTEGELAAASYALVLDALKPRLDAVAQGSGDVEQKQAELQAKWETLTGKIGEGIEGPLTALLDWIIQGIEGWELFGKWLGTVEQGFRDFLGPVADARDALEDVLRLIGLVDGASFNSGTLKGGRNVTLNVVPKDSADTERAVLAALADYNARNGDRGF